MLLVFSVLVSSSSTSSVLLVHLRLYKLYKHFGTTQLYTFKHLYMLYVCTGCTRIFTIYTIYHIPYIVYTNFSGQLVSVYKYIQIHPTTPEYTQMHPKSFVSNLGEPRFLGILEICFKLHFLNRRYAKV